MMNQAVSWEARAAVSRDELLRQARILARVPRDLTRAPFDAVRRARFLRASFFSDLVQYLEPSLQLVFRSQEIELARRISISDAGHRLTVRFVLRSDGSLVKYDEANDYDPAHPVELLADSASLDAVLGVLERVFTDEGSPISFAAADEIRTLRGFLSGAS